MAKTMSHTYRDFPLFREDYTIMESEDDLCGPSDAELDSEVEEMDGDDAEQELSVWLDQLNMIQQTMFQTKKENGSAPTDVQKRHSRVALTPKMAMDSFRISILESGGTQDVDLDAILGELCELETQLSTQQSEINTSIQTSTSAVLPPSAGRRLPHPASSGAAAASSSGGGHYQYPHHPHPHHTPHPQHPQHHHQQQHHQQQQHCHQQHGGNQQPPPVPPHTAPKPDTQPPSQRDSGFEHIDSQFQSALTELSGLGESLDYGADGSGGHDGLPRRSGRMMSQQHHGGVGGHAGGEECGNHDYDYPPSERGEDVGDPSQDTDSAYSDTISLPSSGSHISVTTTSSQNSGSSGSSGIGSGVSPTAPGDYAARVKAEKVKLALDKIKEANIKKSVRLMLPRLIKPGNTMLFVRCYTLDGSSKSILVDENMTVAQVCDILVVKNHATPSIHWAVVEQLPDLYMERMLEDHDNLVDNILMWSRDSTNKLIFLERPDKYDVFRRPEEYLLGSGGATDLRGKIDDAGRSSLIQEYFSPTSKRVPEMEGMLYLKAEGKKAWKRFYFVLRASGLYYNPKGKSKTSRDLVCLQQCDFVEIYTGLGWKKKYKAPTEHCFALKHPQIQKKAVKYIRYLCADNALALHQWITAIRIAKHGHQMLINFESVKNSIVTWDSRQMVPHQDLVSLLSQPAPAHMAALAAQKGGPGGPAGGKDPVVQSMPQSAARCPHHQRVPSGGGIPGSERLSGTGSDRLSTGSDRLSSGSQRRASQGSVGSPRHHSQGSIVGLGGGSEDTQHRPTKMTPVIPVTTEVTKQITEVQNKKPNIQRIPPQQHPPQRTSLDGPPNTGSMDLPPPPPEMMIAPLSAHEAVLSAEPPPSYPAGSGGDFPLPPPPSSMEQYGRPAPTAGAGSQPGSNRSSTSSSSMGLPPSPASQSPRHSVHHSSPRHSVSVKPPMMHYGSPTATPPPPPPAMTTSSPSPQAPPTPPTPSAMTASMPGSPQNQPMSPSSASLQHRRSSSGPSTPTHGGGRKPPPPPPPRRSDTTQLSQYQETSTGRYFMADLSRVLTLKQGRSRQFMQQNDSAPEFPPAPPPIAPLPQPHYTSVENDDFSDLPPPPEELLEGLPGHEKRKPPPPPPKRHLQTQLSFSRGQIS